jgi:hypothetical protein
MAVEGPAGGSFDASSLDADGAGVSVAGVVGAAARPKGTTEHVPGLIPPRIQVSQLSGEDQHLRVELHIV